MITRTARARRNLLTRCTEVYTRDGSRPTGRVITIVWSDHYGYRTTQDLTRRSTTCSEYN
jgi:hypothetical protein